MDPALATVGIWKHWKIIVGALAFFFVAAVVADVVMWYSLQKSNTAAQTLNDIIASQPPAPKTDEDKTKLLDDLAAAHRAAAAQVEAQSAKKKGARTSAPATADSPTPDDPALTDPAVQAKIKLLDSLRKSR